ncbi:tRNA 2-thiocytidine biosynthesis TtcA family protein [Treponema parvum]|uniref:tRNA 2-thiocytidine biosynthesis TtcA family protein n=1 Tax=Treponema parvum TaxID=138851 RepID=UPI001AEBABB4|nr:tRNA 2-thiocytidine biosynthesis TtcA family protein [Treponema parvum]QTQ16639.1 tRNA 2-thiocytidine biosynthesis protein TtcA [Treponema parvum]
MPQPLLFRLIDKAVFEYALIEKGDRILVGASGGKDSTALIEYLANRRRRRSADFDFTALHISSEITKPLNSGLTLLFNSWRVKTEDIYVNVLGRIKQGQKMNCWWCSTQRRTELLQYALSNGFNKIALGHHLDDILETLLMNVLEQGELSTMPPRLKYEKYSVTVIRPLCYVPESLIKKHAEDRGYMSEVCTCDHQTNSLRKEARAKLETLTDGSCAKKERLFAALKNIKSEYLP